MPRHKRLLARGFAQIGVGRDRRSGGSALVHPFPYRPPRLGLAWTSCVPDYIRVGVGVGVGVVIRLGVAVGLGFGVAVGVGVGLGVILVGEAGVAVGVGVGVNCGVGEGEGVAVGEGLCARTPGSPGTAAPAKTNSRPAKTNTKIIGDSLNRMIGVMHG